MSNPSNPPEDSLHDGPPTTDEPETGLPENEIDSQEPLIAEMGQTVAPEVDIQQSLPGAKPVGPYVDPVGPLLDMEGNQVGWAQMTWYNQADQEANSGDPVVANLAQDPPEGMHFCGVVLQLPSDFSKDDLPPLLALDELQTRAFLGAFLGYHSK